MVHSARPFLENLLPRVSCFLVRVALATCDACEQQNYAIAFRNMVSENANVEKKINRNHSNNIDSLQKRNLQSTLFAHHGLQGFSSQFAKCYYHQGIIQNLHIQARKGSLAKCCFKVVDKRRTCSASAKPRYFKKFHLFTFIPPTQ